MDSGDGTLWTLSKNISGTGVVLTKGVVGFEFPNECLETDVRSPRRVIRSRWQEGLLDDIDKAIWGDNKRTALNELHLFAGAGGGILGGILLGHTCVCAVEIEPYCRKVLFQRQRDGILPKFPIWDDVRTFDGKPWRGLVDVVCGGFPCKGISLAGKGDWLEHPETGLWSEQARIVSEVLPRIVVVENTPALTSRGFGVVLGDLAAMGYNARWGVLGADEAGAPQTRKRMWLVAYSDRERCWEQAEESLQPGRATIEFCSWWRMEPGLGRVAYGLADQVDRTRAIGNGQVPAVVKLAWNTLMPADK